MVITSNYFGKNLCCTKGRKKNKSYKGPLTRQALIKYQPLKNSRWVKVHLLVKMFKIIEKPITNFNSVYSGKLGVFTEFNVLNESIVKDLFDLRSESYKSLYGHHLQYSFFLGAKVWMFGDLVKI